MSDDTKDDELPEPLRQLVEKLRGEGGQVEVIKLSKDGKIDKTGDNALDELLSKLRNLSDGTVVDAEFKSGAAVKTPVELAVAINRSAEFQSGLVRSIRDPEKLLPALVCKIPFEKGTKNISIEFEDAQGLYKLMDALMLMMTGSMYANVDRAKKEIDEQLQKKGQDSDGEASVN